MRFFNHRFLEEPSPALGTVRGVNFANNPRVFEIATQMLPSDLYGLGFGKKICRLVSFRILQSNFYFLFPFVEFAYFQLENFN